MKIETERIIIRSIQRGDEKAYAEMARDGSLAEIGFDEAFSDWADGWINEAIELTEKDDPRADYIPCTIILKSTGEVIGDVWVVAPDGQRSTASHRITLHQPVDVNPAVDCYGDCLCYDVIGEKTWLGKLNKVIWMQYLNCISSCMRTVSLKTWL